MSFDINLITICNHKIYREPVTLDSDRRTLRVVQPIASTVEVFASNDKVNGSKYTLIDDPTMIDVYKGKLIYLNESWDSLEDYFEVSYYTISNFCPKCQGVKSVDDVSYNVQGDFFIIRDEKLLLQNLEKFTVTEVFSNPFHTFIGTSLVKMLGQKIADRNYLSAKITQEINSTLSVLRSLQSQYVATGRPTSYGELLDSVNNIKITFDSQDPTILRADIDCRAKSGKSVDYTQYLKRVA
jgi:hypothetical protein